MTKIAHIADLHYRGLSRHDEYRRVFEDFVEKIKAQGVQHVFVGGDIFHTKTIAISPEFIIELTWMLKHLASVAKVHLTLGNHDGNLTNLSRQDAITPIIQAMDDSNIFLYKDSGVYEFAPGFNWCVFSLFDTKNWNLVKPVPGAINIACYHGPVWGALTESDWEIKEGLSVLDFKEYDFCFLGDIHRTQFLDYREYELTVPESEIQNYDVIKVIS